MVVPLDNECLIKTSLKLFKTCLGLPHFLWRYSLALYFQEDGGNRWQAVCLCGLFKCCNLM